MPWARRFGRNSARYRVGWLVSSFAIPRRSLAPRRRPWPDGTATSAIRNGTVPPGLRPGVAEMNQLNRVARGQLAQHHDQPRIDAPGAEIGPDRAARQHFAVLQQRATCVTPDSQRLTRRLVVGQAGTRNNHADLHRLRAGAERRDHGRGYSAKLRAVLCTDGSRRDDGRTRPGQQSARQQHDLPASRIAGREDRRARHRVAPDHQA